MLKDKIDPEAFAATICQTAPDKCYKKLATGASLDEAQRELATWDFQPHLKAIKENSAKFSYLLTLIRNIMAD